MNTTELPPVMIAAIERLLAKDAPVPPDMRAAYERQTGRTLPSSPSQPSVIDTPKAAEASCRPINTPTRSVAPTIQPRVMAPSVGGKPRVKSDKGLFTGIPDAELNAFSAATDGMDAAGGIAVLVGLRRALRAALRRCASDAPYGPATLVQADIANLSFCSLATVKRWLPVLERAGIVRIQRSRKASGENNPSIYTMLFPVGKMRENVNHSTIAHNEPGGGLTMSQGVSSRLQNEPRATPEETIETVETIETSSPVAGDDLFATEASTVAANRPTERPRNLLFDALALATDGDPSQLTADSARAVGVALSKILKVAPDLTPDEIHRRAANYRDHFPDAALTASALAKHWARCAQNKNSTGGSPGTDWTRSPLSR